MTPLGLGIGFSPVYGQAKGLLFRYAPGMTVAALGGTYTGTGPRTYIDQNGILQTTTGIREWVHYINGVPTTLLEAARTNSFLNSGAPATHTSPSLGVGTYTLWLVGTGSIAVAAGTATITGAGTATSAAPVTFTVTVAGTVTFTVTGAPTRAQCENGAFATSYIATVGAAVTRIADGESFPWPSPPSAITMYAKFTEAGTAQTTSARLLALGGGGTPRLTVLSTGAFYQVNHNNGTASVTSTLGIAPAIGDTVELRVVLNADGSVLIGQSINGGAESIAAVSAANALAVAWTTPLLWVNSEAANAVGFTAFQSVKIALGARDMPTVRVA